eukprot:10923359-Ditylum_brightwellii.AAC.1
MAMATVVAKMGVIIIWFRQSHSIHVKRLYPGGVLPPNIDRDWETHMPQALGMWLEIRWICMQTLAVQKPTGMWLPSLGRFVGSIHFLTHMNHCKRCHWPNVSRCLLTNMMVQKCYPWQIRCYGLEPNYLIA